MPAPAEVFHPSEYVLEELAERGWTTNDLVAAAGGDAIDILAADLYIAVHDPNVVIGDLASVFARGFGTSEQLWRNLHATWLENSISRAAHPLPSGRG